MAEYIEGLNIEKEKQQLAELLTTGPNKEYVWDIVTALRGPDDDNEKIKLATTAVIRWHTLKLTKNSPSIHSYGELFKGITENKVFVHNGSFVCPDSDELVEIRLNYGTHSHFFTHARAAFEALGLNWGSVNS